MGWYLDNTRIFLTDASQSDKGTIARLSPLGGGTIHHYWGWEEPVMKLKAYVVGNADKNTIQSMVRDGAIHGFTGVGFVYADWNWTYSGWIHDISWDITTTSQQTLRTDLDCYSPVFVADIEFYVEE